MPLLHKRFTDIEAEIECGLSREKEIAENKDLPISDYNYSDLQDRLKKNGARHR